MSPNNVVWLAKFPLHRQLIISPCGISTDFSLNHVWSANALYGIEIVNFFVQSYCNYRPWWAVDCYNRGLWAVDCYYSLSWAAAFLDCVTILIAWILPHSAFAQRPSTALQHHLEIAAMFKPYCLFYHHIYGTPRLAANYTRAYVLMIIHINIYIWAIDNIMILPPKSMFSNSMNQSSAQLLDGYQNEAEYRWKPKREVSKHVEASWNLTVRYENSRKL